MPVVSIPFVVLAGDDVDGLHAEGVSRPERRRDVAEVGEALHDEAHGVAPALGGAADPVPARLEALSNTPIIYMMIPIGRSIC